jgi:hypothetical protein
LLRGIVVVSRRPSFAEATEGEYDLHGLMEGFALDLDEEVDGIAGQIALGPGFDVTRLASIALRPTQQQTYYAWHKV